MIITLTILSAVVLIGFAAYAVIGRSGNRRHHPVTEMLSCAAVIASTCWTIAIASHLFTKYTFGRVEIDGSDYQVVASIKGHDAALDGIIAEAMLDGSISYWEFDRIRRMSEANDQAEGRTGLAKSLSDGRPPVLKDEKEKEGRS